MSAALLAVGFMVAPYVQDVGPEGAVIAFAPETQAPATVTVEGPAGYRRRLEARPDAERRASVRVEGLAPASVYTYRVSVGGQSASGRFRTPPLPGLPFSFVVYGDNRSDHHAHHYVMSALAAADPDLIISTGDLVANGSRPAQWKTFFDIEGRILRGVPLYPVVGNHDVYGDGFDRFRAWFHLPGNEAYYSFTWGNVGFVAIDSEINVDAEGGPDAEQSAWLLAEVKRLEGSPGIDHVIGFVHKGPYSSNPRRRGNRGVRRLTRELVPAGLDLLLCGHDHYYERGRTEYGLPYLVVGSGGAPLYHSEGEGRYDGFEVQSNHITNAFVRMRSAGPYLDGCAVDTTGRSLDCFEIGPGRGRP